ncbi:MAG: methionine gamma-lyase family protein [Oscillospiraceae bacterium]|jgi:cystathionine beta-lyase family protein involved in aluminum resistance|nr:methionine gamma-lyase family protein [Oscillospiraceae bacterium]
MRQLKISPEIRGLAAEVEKELAGVFAGFSRVAEACTFKVMSAFQEFRVSEACFAGTTGYGYNDLGRDTLDRIYARVFGAESALVRLGFVNGTHAIAAALFAVCRPGDTLLSVTGTPYDTLRRTIGIANETAGSLKSYGIDYAQVDLLPDGGPDIAGIKRAASDPRVGAVEIQRSRGYALRRAFGVAEIGTIIEAVRAVNRNASILVDNCYGEFTEELEPTAAGADLIAGSLIKNPGGGLAPTGGYVAGRADLVERAAMRLTAPGIGGACGSTLGNNRLLYQGFFMAPHTVSQALKTVAFCAGLMARLGLKSTPAQAESRYDIIQTIEFGSAEKLLRFCKGIQSGSPIDSHVTPVPWAMPGYEDEIVMAAGAFIQGASIELSCDGPMRAPYLGFVQGGLSYESGKLGIMLAAAELLKA